MTAIATTATGTATSTQLTIDVAGLEEALVAAEPIDKKEQVVFQWLSAVERELVRTGAVEKVLLSTYTIPSETSLLKHTTIPPKNHTRNTTHLKHKAALAAAQPGLEKTLFKLLNSALPRPSRPLRQIIGRIYVLAFTHGETRSLFEVLASLQGILNQKKLDDVTIKMQVFVLALNATLFF